MRSIWTSFIYHSDSHHIANLGPMFEQRSTFYLQTRNGYFHPLAFFIGSLLVDTPVTLFEVIKGFSSCYQLSTNFVSSSLTITVSYIRYYSVLDGRAQSNDRSVYLLLSDRFYDELLDSVVGEVPRLCDAGPRERFSIGSSLHGVPGSNNDLTVASGERRSICLINNHISISSAVVCWLRDIKGELLGWSILDVLHLAILLRLVFE